MMHEQCRDVFRHSHHLSACPAPECVPVHVPAIDLGDDSLMRQRRSDAKYADRLGQILARGPYSPSEIRMHCQEMYARKMGAVPDPSAQSGPSGLSGMFRIFGRGTEAQPIASPPQYSPMFSQGAYNPHQVNWEKAKDFARVHRSTDKFREAGITFVTMYDSGVTVTDLVKVGQYTLRELAELGMTWEYLLLLDLSWEHLKEPLPFPASDLNLYFGATYMSVIKLAAGEGGDLVLGLERFCTIGFTREDMLHLQMTDVARLMDLGLTQAHFLKLAQWLTLDDMIQLKLNKSQLEKLELVSLEKWSLMIWGDPDVVCSKLNIPKSTFAPAPSSVRSAESEDPSSSVHSKDRGRSLPGGHHRRNATRDEEMAYAVRALTRHSATAAASRPTGYQQPSSDSGRYR